MTADIADMGIFQQVALRLLEDGRDRKEERPGSHLGFIQKITDQQDQVDETKEGKRKSLKKSVEGGTDPI